jgi:hypothetical protein
MTQLTSRLVIDAGNPAVRIEVIDSDFQICARGYGHIEEELPTGFYTVRYRAGDAVKERNIKIQPDQPLELLKPPKLSFGSAAPIEQSWTSDENHQVQAKKLSLTPQLERGQGSELFLFGRDLAAGGKGSPLQGMSLHRLDGRSLVDLGKESSKSMDPNLPLWAGCNVALDPGRYRLRFAFQAGQSLETMMVACPNWQSQIFLLRRRSESKTGNSDLLDLSSATQFMSRRGEGFRSQRIPSDQIDLQNTAQDTSLAELAQIAVANDWRGFRTSDLSALLKGKFYDPLLGILGLHLLLTRPEPDLVFAEQVVERLQQDILMGFSHPDVEALRIEIARRQGRGVSAPAIESPPMLRRSWFLLLQATAEKPSLIPNDSFSSKIADRLWGSGAWLTWVAPDTKPGVPADEIYWPSSDYRQTSPLRGFLENLSVKILELDPRKFWQISQAMQVDWPEEWLGKKDNFELLRKELEEFLPSIKTLMQDHDGIEELAQQAKLDRGEFTLLSLLSVNLQTDILKSKKTQQDPLSLESLIKALGMPADRIQIMMIGLLAKLTPLVGSPS